MTHVFLIHTHRDREQIVRLVSTLRQNAPDAVILVSHDRNGEPLGRTDFGDHAVNILESVGGRGDFSIIDGYITALRWLESNRIAYDWITNLSGQDYPSRPFSVLDHDLRQSEFDGYLHHFPVVGSSAARSHPFAWDAQEGQSRYYFQYDKLKNDLNKIERAPVRLLRNAVETLSQDIRINASYGLMVGTRARRPPFDAHFKCYAGSYWHTIRSECARYVLKFHDENESIVNYFRKVLIPDESFLQTVLVNNRNFRFANDNLRYFDFTESRHGRPKTLVAADFSNIKRSGAFFARKLETVASDSLYFLLDERLKQS